MPQLNWKTRDHDIQAATAVPHRVLQELPQLSYGEPSENLLVQGDNLEALKALLPFYAGKVKCIYIDPPYNSRSAFKRYDDALEHSKWLGMMAARLNLLREFLSPDGSIWVSIDDREGHYLKVLMDEIFGRENFECTFVWQKVDSPNNNRIAIAPDHEFILCYRSPGGKASFKKKPDSSILSSYRTTPDEPRPHKDRTLIKKGKASLREDRPSMYFALTAPDGSAVYPIHEDGKDARWAFGQSGVQKLIHEKRLIWKKRRKKGQEVWSPYSREFAPTVLERPHQTILLDVKTSRQAKAHARELFPDMEPFDTIKPEQLLGRILDASTEPGDLVLDCFLGSGTTAAVAHKMGRRWVGIERGEHAHEICAERLKKVINGEEGGISDEADWKGGGGFRFCTLGPTIFNELGRINPEIGFADLARHIWFAENHTPLNDQTFGTAIGVSGGTAYALLFNGILKDRSPDGGNVLTSATLRLIRQDTERLSPGFDGEIVVYATATRIGDDRARAERITFKQTPYDISVRG